MHPLLRSWRLWLVLIALLVFPTLTYWDTIFAHFGLRDDYSVLREVHQEPGKVTAFCASHARPVFGWMSEQTLRWMYTIHDLQWARLLAAICAGLTAAGTAWVLVRLLSWRLATAALTGALVAVLPGTQVIVGWAICWGHLMGLVLGIAGFAAAEYGLRAHHAGPRWGWLLVGWAIVVTGALTYQSNVLFYTAFIAASLPRQRAWTIRGRVRWLATHLGVIFVGMCGAFLIAKLLFATGVFAQSDRVAFEPHLIKKIIWFLNAPLSNALSFLVINDDLGRTAVWHMAMATVVAAVIGFGAIRESRRHGRTAGAFWLLGLLGLPLLAYSVSIIASEQWSTYRTIFSLTGVVLIYFVQGLDHVGKALPKQTRWFTPLTLVIMVVGGFGMARRQAYDLIAVPQMKELALIDTAAKRIDPTRNTRVFVMTPDCDDSFAELTYADEFGSLSTASDWTPKEMLQDLMRERFPAIPDVTSRYTFASGWERPAAGQYDVLIDLNRTLTEMHQKEVAKVVFAGPVHVGYFGCERAFGIADGLRRWPVFALLGLGLFALWGSSPPFRRNTGQA